MNPSSKRRPTQLRLPDIVPRRKPQPAPVRAAILAFLSEPQPVAEVRRRLGRAFANSYLNRLARQGFLVRVGHGVYARPDQGHEALPPRPILDRGAIRASILAYLSEPRQAFEIAAHIDRSIPNATGHLGAMARLGFVVRIGYGRYARADQGHEVPPASALVQPRRNMARVLEAIASQASIEEVAALLGIRHVAATYELHRLVQEGRAERTRLGVYRRLPATSVAAIQPPEKTKHKPIRVRAFEVDSGNLTERRFPDAILPV